LEGKTVLITGANNPVGIGAATARAFARQGARLLLHFLALSSAGDHQDGTNSDPGKGFYLEQNRKNADQVLDEVNALGTQAAAYEADLSDPEKIPNLFEVAEQRFGQVDILVNNAADWQADTFIPSDQHIVNPVVEMWTDRPAQITAESFAKNFLVNTRANALLMAEFTNRHLKGGRTWGRIINISSGGARCFPSEISYGASKLALEGYTRSAAVELGQFGITVNAISPGPIQTGWITSEMEQVIKKEIPLGRIGLPEDVADTVVMIASDQARWITGQLIQVGGGHTI
jgi:3-oxoacyl-[acyl-carrier protein] reductase